jgi:hypothetical protein
VAWYLIKFKDTFVVVGGGVGGSGVVGAGVGVVGAGVSVVGVLGVVIVIMVFATYCRISCP